MMGGGAIALMMLSLLLVADAMGRIEFVGVVLEHAGDIASAADGAVCWLRDNSIDRPLERDGGAL